MNRVQRWIKFNMVGAMGMAMQLGALWLLNRTAPGHYLAWTATAVELAILHNFMWHRRYTWNDRPHVVAGQALVMFHAANGLVSLAGNVFLMRVFVGVLHWPVLIGNVAAVAGCSLVNFWVGDTVVFRSTKNVTLEVRSRTWLNKEAQVLLDTHRYCLRSISLIDLYSQLCRWLRRVFVRSVKSMESR